MSSLYIPLIFLLVSFIIDKVRENNKTKEKTIKRVKKKKPYIFFKRQVKKTNFKVCKASK